MNQRLKYWLPVLLWALVIFLMSTDIGSASHTARFITPILRWLMPHISPAGISRWRKGNFMTISFPAPMPMPLTAMYLLSVVIGVTSYLVSRGPDGKFAAFFVAFAVIAVVYVALAWVTRHRPIWPHIGVHLLLFTSAAALGMAPKPHLDEMAGMLYMFLPAAIAGMILLASLARFLARWI